MSRRKAREMALQVLFQVDIGGASPDKAMVAVFAENGASVDAQAFTTQLVSGTLAHRAEIDRRIQEHAFDWKIDRMSGVDRNILRLGTYELFYGAPDVPSSVAINEAVELAKKFGTEESGKFVNGLLGAMVKTEQEDGNLYRH